MFDHVTIRVSDRAAAERFYDTVLGELGVERTSTGPDCTEWGDFSLAQATAARPVTRGLHVGFAAPSTARADAFWRAGVDAGFSDDGAPGPRPQYGPDYYGAFLRDPDGNSVEAVWHGNLRTGGIVDHLWIRVRDVATSRRFYETVAPHAGWRVVAEHDGYVRFSAGDGSFSLVRGAPTEHLQVAFAARDRAAVAAFHAAATAAGYRDNGPPGVRPAYPAGSYGALVADADGHDVEAVHRTRR